MLHEKLQTHIVGYYNVRKYKLQSDILKKTYYVCHERFRPQQYML